MKRVFACSMSKAVTELPEELNFRIEELNLEADELAEYEALAMCCGGAADSVS